ncbi:MAG: ComEA family DNA-binding protein [Actinomycetota bacterium]|nr:ComEA family DNA-binding protein [Actinomycetota bacterium]
MTTLTVALHRSVFTPAMSEIIIHSGWRERVEELQSRRGGWVVAGFVLVVVAAALVLWARGAPAQIAPPATPPVGETSALAQTSASPTAGFLYVDVSGAVRRPGLYKLQPGSRVADAIRAAGGAVRRADLEVLNLAQPLTDGVKVDVARKGTSQGAAASSAAATSGEAGTTGVVPSPTVPIVNINTADEPTLELIPGVGPVTANAILDYRNRIGRFATIDQLLDVNGIGPATIENIRPYITI